MENLFVGHWCKSLCKIVFIWLNKAFKIKLTFECTATSSPNSVKISQRVAELRRFICFKNGGLSPSWMFKVNFQNGERRHLVFFGSEIWRQQKSRPGRIYLRTKFGEDISKGGRVTAIYVLKMAAHRHLGCWWKWNLKVLLFPGHRL